MINFVNFIFNILFYFLAVSIPLILVLAFFILAEYLEERNEVELDDTSKIFRYDLRKLKGLK